MGDSLAHCNLKVLTAAKWLAIWLPLDEPQTRKVGVLPMAGQVCHYRSVSVVQVDTQLTQGGGPIEVNQGPLALA